MKSTERRGAARSLRLKLTLWFLAVFSILHVLLLGAVVSFRKDLVRDSNENRVEFHARSLVDNIALEWGFHDREARSRAEDPSTAEDLPLEAIEWTEAKIHALLPSDAPFEFLVVRRVRSEESPRNEESPKAWNVEAGADVPFTLNESVPTGPLGAVFSRITGEPAAALAPDASSVELLTLPFRLRKSEYFLQAGVLESELEGAVRPFLDLFLLGIPLASLAALAAAWVISGRAVEPLVRLSRAARDVSPSRLGERIALESQHEEVSALQDELNQALERLEAGYRAQEAFISNVSHELKTPIAVLRSQSQLLKDGSHSPAAHKAFVASVDEETKHLGRMVESFLALARHGWANRLTEATDVPAIDIVLDAVRHASPLAEQHGIRLSPSLRQADEEEDSPVVAGDAALLETMLENLVRNAIRFSPKGGTVHVEAEGGPDEVALRVRDAGPGIPPDMLERIFERFVGWEDPRGGRGAGIGLTIARNVAELHKGRIAAENHPDGGAVVSVHLPRAREA